MDKLTQQIRKHEKIGDTLLAIAVISFLVSTFGLILLLVFSRHVSHAPFLVWLDGVAGYIMDNIIVWIPGSIFVFYFILLAVLSFLGINIGPKE